MQNHAHKLVGKYLCWNGGVLLGILKTGWSYTRDVNCFYFKEWKEWIEIGVHRN